MTAEQHYRALEAMYAKAPINDFYRPELRVGEGIAELEIPVEKHLYHAAGAVHGSVYFKMLDDAAWFAANSLEQERFVLTASFTTYLTRPVTAPTMRSEGRVVHASRSQMIAEAVAFDADGREVGRGNGIFVRGPQRLTDMPGYGG